MSNSKKTTGSHKARRASKPVVQPKKTAQITPALMDTPVPAQTRRQPKIPPGAMNFKPVNEKLVNTMYQQMSPQLHGTTMYAPGAPIMPVPGLSPDEGPRQYDYTQGYNVAQLPRSTEQYSFWELRTLAAALDAIGLCEQVWFDYISKLELVIEPRPDLIGEDHDISEYEEDINYYKAFFAYPDKHHDLKEWMRMAVRDQLEIDAVAIFVRKNKIGGVYALDLIDGSTIKPLIDDRGRRPEVPFPAYEQFDWGIPSCFLTSDDLIYIKESERSESVYGRSRVEKIILKINMALRKQTKDLARFTDGSMPGGFIQQDQAVTWTQEEVEDFEAALNDQLAGNDVMRARIKVLPRGFTYVPTDDPDIHIDLDNWIIQICAADFGISMEELAITATSNRSVGESQENMVYRRAMSPLMDRYAQLFTKILQKYFNEDRFIAKWKGFEEQEDFNQKAQAFIGLANAGIVSQTRAAHLLSLPVDGPDLPSPLLITKSGPVRLSDFADDTLHKAQMDAQMAGLTMAKTNPGANATGDQQDDDQGGQEDEDGAEEGKKDKPSETSPEAKRTDEAERTVHIEYRRWRDATLHDLKAARSIRRFESNVIPQAVLAVGAIGLSHCKTPDEVKQFFETMRSVACA